MTESQIKKILRDKKIKAAGNFSDREINNLFLGRFTVPTFNRNIFKDIRKNNPEIAPYISNIRDSFLSLERAYDSTTLQTDKLPDIKIGD
jgi:hypothetical protein